MAKKKNNKKSNKKLNKKKIQKTNIEKNKVSKNNKFSNTNETKKENITNNKKDSIEKQPKKDYSNKKNIIKNKTNEKKLPKKYSKQKLTKNNTFIWTIIIILFTFAITFFYCFLLPNISLIGKKSIVVDYGSKYIDPGYKSFYQGKNITDKVVITNNVNTKKLGRYIVTYKIKYKSFTKKVYRKVIVKDITAPKIKFSLTSNTIYTCPGKKVVAPFFIAVDNMDGNLTSKVKVKKHKNYISYKVCDNHFNCKSVKKKIKYNDIEKPKIKLLGSKNTTVFIGDNFTDPLYEVSDNCDNNLKDKVVISSNLDMNKLGNYKIKYSVSDKKGNSTTVIRNVRVIEHNKKGSVYLTFDDGPKDGTTNIILDILKQEGIKATFFVTNSGPDELIKREYDEGHTVALHTSSHDYSTVYSSDDNYFNDLKSVFDRVKRITGQNSTYIRFPGGSSNTVSRKYSIGIMSRLTDAVQKKGFKYYDWNLSSGDAEPGHHEKDEIYHNVVDNLSKDRVNMVLMHDIKPYTRDALEAIIKYCKENGYTLEKIDENTEMVTQKVNN